MDDVVDTVLPKDSLDLIEAFLIAPHATGENGAFWVDEDQIARLKTAHAVNRV